MTWCYFELFVIMVYLSNGAFFYNRGGMMDGYSHDQQDQSNLLSPYGNQRRIKRIYQIFIIVILIGLVAGEIILATHHDWLQMVLVGIAFLLVLASSFYILKDKYELATIILALILFSLITCISTYGLGIHAITNLGFPAILIISSLVIRKRTLSLLFLYAVGCIAWLVFGELNDLYTPTVLVRSVPGDFFTVLVVLTGTAIMVRLLSESLFKSHRELEKELSERKRAEGRLAYDALHDTLTNLPNRTLFNDRLGQRFEHARRHPDEMFAVLFIDLDRFKVVNDSLGHAIGDLLLIETAQRLAHCMRPDDTVARLGGDEFAILLNEFHEIGNAVHVANRIQSELIATSMVEGYNRVTTASVGITVYNERYVYPQEMLRDSDAAMYRAKSKGGGQYAIFDDSMHANAMALLQLEADLKYAVENHEWQVYYQPIVSLPTRNVIGVEALLRWKHPQRGIIEPVNFIRVAEETGLILPMGEFVLREACRQAEIWRTRIHPGLKVSVNLSGRQFQNPDLVKITKEILEETGLPGEGLQLEITESVAMKDLAFSAVVLKNLSQLGIHISLDDFGNGYSSLGYLHSFPIKILKIDKTFIQGLPRDHSSKTITKAIISLSHALNMQVVAEGVEREEQLAFLESLSCDQVQGHLIGCAMSAEQVETYL